jgi:hypothetical protein
MLWGEACLLASWELELGTTIIIGAFVVLVIDFKLHK